MKNGKNNNKIVCVSKQTVINKLYGAYKNMCESGETERAKGMWKAIKLINHCCVFDIDYYPKWYFEEPHKLDPINPKNKEDVTL